MKWIYRIAIGLVGTVVLAIGALAVVVSYSASCGDAPQYDGDDGMRAVTARCYGSPDVLAVERLPIPEVGARDVLVRVRAASANPLDWHYMRGSPYIMRLQAGIGRPNDIGVGVDFAGVVEAVGDEVTRFAPGDAVFGGASGAFADYVAIAEDRSIAHKPEGVSFEAAAGVPIAALTALQAIRDKGEVGAGDRVLINGASGGVGTFAVQIAKSLGATVTGVSSARNHELVLGLGADRMIDYKSEDYTTGGDQYDVIVDMVGNHSPAENQAVLADNGRYVGVGGAKGDWIGPFANPIRVLFASSETGQTFHTLLARLNPDDLDTIAEMLGNGTIRTVIDREFTLDDAAEAIRYSESGRARGKIIVRVAD